MRKIMLVIFILALVCVGMVGAQEEEFTCTAQEFRDMFVPLLDAIKGAMDNATTDAEALTLFLGIETVIANVRLACGGTREFTSEAYPNGIIGPISFSGTLYQVSISSTGGDASFSTTVIEGDCDIIPPGIFTTNGGNAETDLWEPGGDCMAMFEVNTYGATGWVLDFERLQ